MVCKRKRRVAKNDKNTVSGLGWLSAVQKTMSRQLETEKFISHSGFRLLRHDVSQKLRSLIIGRYTHYDHQKVRVAIFSKQARGTLDGLIPWMVGWLRKGRRNTVFQSFSKKLDEIYFLRSVSCVGQFKIISFWDRHMLEYIWLQATYEQQIIVVLGILSSQC